MNLAKSRKILIYVILGLVIVLSSKLLLTRLDTSASQLTITKTQIEFPFEGDHLNVKNFGAKGDGRTDDTIAIQKAIDSTTRGFQTIYFPQGTYLVSQTIQLGRIKIIQGANQEQTIIRLQDNSFKSNEASKPLLRSMYNNNQTFGIYIKDLTVNTGRENPQAIGIQYNTHNTGAIENVTIKSEDTLGTIGLDLSETEFGPGMIKNVRIEGFDVGIKTPGAPSNAVFSNIYLSKQNVVGFENNMPVAIENLKSENQVPAIRNNAHALAHLVLVNADLVGLGNSSTTSAAIESEGAYYLRNIAVSNYQVALKDREQSFSQARIAEKWSNFASSVAANSKGHLKLTVKEPPLSYIEPIENWVIPNDSEEDDTAAIQAAMDSGAKTIFFPGNTTYQISKTIEVPPTVRRIVGQHRGIKGTEKFISQPILRIVGNTSEPIGIESMSVGAWPHSIIAFEVASDRPTYFKYSNFIGVKNTIITNPTWSGEIYLDEYLGKLRIDGTGSVWIRQWNPENNPFSPEESDSKLRYAVNNGGKLWALGTKTEAPAINVVTQNKGQTEMLGGFFRDHFAPDEYQPEVPYFKTTNAALSASYLQYAWGPGKARKFQAIETQQEQEYRLITPPELLTVELYRSRN